MPMSQPGDEQLGCADLNKQIVDNDKAAREFWEKNAQTKRENAAKVMGAVIPGVGLLIALSSDLSSEGQIKARAMIDRNERLMFLAKQKGCMQ